MIFPHFRQKSEKFVNFCQKSDFKSFSDDFVENSNFIHRMQNFEYSGISVNIRIIRRNSVIFDQIGICGIMWVPSLLNLKFILSSFKQFQT